MSVEERFGMIEELSINEYRKNDNSLERTRSEAIKGAQLLLLEDNLAELQNTPQDQIDQRAEDIFARRQHLSNEETDNQSIKVESVDALSEAVTLYDNVVDETDKNEETKNEKKIYTTMSTESSDGTHRDASSGISLPVQRLHLSSFHSASSLSNNDSVVSRQHRLPISRTDTLPTEHDVCDEYLETITNSCETSTITFAVFFEGTSNTLKPITTQIGIFAEACQAFTITKPDDLMLLTCGHGNYYKMAFDGCGVTDGIMGMLFAAGLERQCDQVVAVVSKMRRLFPSRHIKVVAMGLSRGGVACLKLIRKLCTAFDEGTHANKSKTKTDFVSITSLLFDPVPGNAVQTGFPCTAAWSMDLSACRLLKRVVALYPYEPLPDLFMHAPCFVSYHPDTRVEEDVTLGCHQGALFRTTPYPLISYDVASNLSFRRLADFYEEEGIPMKFNTKLYQPSLQDCVNLCREALREHHGQEPILRKIHDRTGQRRIILRRGGHTTMCRFLNRHHEQLETALMCQQQQSDKRESSPPQPIPAETDSFSCHSYEWHQYQLEVQPKSAVFRSGSGKQGLMQCGSGCLL